MKRKPSPLAPGRVEPNHLAELVDFQPDQGIIRLHEQRMVLLSAAAMGLMRKELIDTLGFDTARRVFLRFGYADGYHDAVSMRERSDWPIGLEGLRAGVALQRLEGIIRAEILQLEHDAKSGRFHEEKLWHDSYIAEQHLAHYGKSSAPVCWSLVGYASGYTSACLGQEIYFQEHGASPKARPDAELLARTRRAGAISSGPCATIFTVAALAGRSSAYATSCTAGCRTWIGASAWWPRVSAS